MRKKHDFWARLGERLDIPREALPAGFGVTLSGRGELTVRGSRQILSYGEENIRLLLTGGVLSIKGEELLVFASADVLMRCKVEEMQAWELLSKDGVVITAPDLEHGGVERTVIVYYVYYR